MVANGAARVGVNGFTKRRARKGLLVGAAWHTLEICLSTFRTFKPRGSVKLMHAAERLLHLSLRLNSVCGTTWRRLTLAANP